MNKKFCINHFNSDDEDFKSLFTCLDSEDDEDFETEMERERQSHVNGVHKPVDRVTDTPKQASKTGDSVSEADSVRNDQLLYDPTSDEIDQKWVDSQRPRTTTIGINEDQKRTNRRQMNSDATLNCPACMALVCLDCQRHEIYRTQYRAMFVFNCRIDFTERLQYKHKQKRRRTDDREEPKGVDNYYPVFCDQCNTQVAVYDTNEVYHFFSVLASY